MSLTRLLIRGRQEYLVWILDSLWRIILRLLFLFLFFSLAPKMLRHGEFKVLWDSLEPSRGGGCEVVGKFSLSFKSLESAVCGLINTLNLAPCDRSDLIEPTLTTQTVLMSGTFYMGGGEEEKNRSSGTAFPPSSSPRGYGVVARGVLFMSPDHGCLLKLVVRSELPQVSEAVLQAFE